VNFFTTTSYTGRGQRLRPLNDFQFLLSIYAI